jgi:hypothetical protein
MVPARREFWFRYLFRKAKLMVITVLAPEMLIGSTIGISSRSELSRKAKYAGVNEWTITHGFFTLMGGFEITSESGTKFRRVHADGIAE